MLNVNPHSLVRQALKYQHTKLIHPVLYPSALYILVHYCHFLGSNNVLNATLGPIIKC